MTDVCASRHARALSRSAPTDTAVACPSCLAPGGDPCQPSPAPLPMPALAIRFALAMPHLACTLGRALVAFSCSPDLRRTEGVTVAAWASGIVQRPEAMPAADVRAVDLAITARIVRERAARAALTEREATLCERMGVRADEWGALLADAAKGGAS